MARTVADAAVLLGAIAGVDPRDAATADSRRRTRRPTTRAFLDAERAEGRAHRRGAQAALRLQRRRRPRSSRTAIADDEGAGAVIVDPADIPDARELRRRRVRGAALRVQGRPGRVPRRRSAGARRCRRWRTSSRSTTSTRDAEMPYFGQELFAQAQAKGPLTDRRTRRRSRSAGGSSRERGHRRRDGEAQAGRARRADRRARRGSPTS